MNLEALIMPFAEIIVKEWDTERRLHGDDDLLVLFSMDTHLAYAIPRLKGLEEPEILGVIPADVLERVQEAPGIREGCFRSFWVLFHPIEAHAAMACIRLSVGADSRILPN